MNDIHALGENLGSQLNFYRVERLLKEEGSLPDDVVDEVVRHIQRTLPLTGIDQPTPSFIIQWLSGLLSKRGYHLDDLPYQSLELSLQNVEMNMLQPSNQGGSRDSTQSPQATSLKIAQYVKKQVAERRVFQPKVVESHQSGQIEIDHLGAVDRPIDIFLTPELIKRHGLPSYTHAPQAGPATHVEVLLSHLVRFTHELQNHFAGTVQWGFVNTLLTPFFRGFSQRQFEQFAQQMLFEFAQLDIGHGGLQRRVVLDFDLEVPAYLQNVPAIGPGGVTLTQTYGDFSEELGHLNHALLEVLMQGDSRNCSFYTPQVVFHLNRQADRWSPLHQKLFETAFKIGNPSIGLSDRRRSLGPIGVVDIHDPDWIRQLQKPEQVRGFSLSSLILNLPRLFLDPNERETEVQLEGRLDEILQTALSAHREKRIFISNLMAKGARGPHQFLRHKIDGEPLLKLNQGSLVTSVVGLAEASALAIGSSNPEPAAVARKANNILKILRQKLDLLSQTHKLNMILSEPVSEDAAFRCALMDFRRFGSAATSYLFKSTKQSEPIYSSGCQTLYYQDLSWSQRLELEGESFAWLNGDHAHVMYYRQSKPDDDTFFQLLLRKIQAFPVARLQFAPDKAICLACGFVHDVASSGNCSSCGSPQTSAFGWNQAAFSPVSHWCRGKQEEWKHRHRFDDWQMPTQELLPFF